MSLVCRSHYIRFISSSSPSSSSSSSSDHRIEHMLSPCAFVSFAAHFSGPCIAKNIRAQNQCTVHTHTHTRRQPHPDEKQKTQNTNHNFSMELSQNAFIFLRLRNFFHQFVSQIMEKKSTFVLSRFLPMTLRSTAELVAFTAQKKILQFCCLCTVQTNISQ